MKSNLDLSDILQPKPKNTNPLKKVGNIISQSIKQSPDADLFAILAGVSAFIPDMEMQSTLLGVVAAKQYFWGWGMYNNVKKAIKSRNGNININALKKRFSTRFTGPCGYFGSKYAIKQYEKGVI